MMYSILRRRAGLALRHVPYWMAVARKAPIEHQVQLLPRFLSADTWWIELDHIPLASDVRNWRLSTHGFAIGGDWDLVHVGPRPSIFHPANEDTVKAMTHRTIRALFVEGHHYRETEQYRFMVEAVKQARPNLAYGCTTVDEVETYFRALINTYTAMQEHGYLTQHELGGSPTDEVKLYLTRTGRWCHGNGGNHRIRIAELLGIRWVPFVLAGAHKDWITSLCEETRQPPRRAMLGWLKASETAGTILAKCPVRSAGSRE
jgi:hypothetical protein